MEFTKKDLLKLYRNIVLAQAYDQFCIRMAMQGKLLSFYHSSAGGEAPGVGGTTFLRPDDIIYRHLRGHGVPHMIGKGASVREYLAEHCGKTTGCSKGLGGIHPSYPELGIFGTGATLGSQFPLSVGWGLGAKKRNKGQVVVIFTGDGTMGRGTWHEAANIAALWKLPVVYVCENNRIAQYVEFKNAYPFENMSRLPAAFGIPYEEVDGQDVIAVAKAVTSAVEKARKGEGPAFIECQTARFGPHGVGNPNKVGGKPRSEEEVAELKKRDSIEICRNRLLKDKVLTQKEVKRIDAEAAAEIADAEKFIDASPIQDDPAQLAPALYAP
ncbi:MAG: thiamine pyrophosphate-dependent dehydrogenase E1 component subunit alpha [bacterium]